MMHSVWQAVIFLLIFFTGHTEAALKMDCVLTRSNNSHAKKVSILLDGSEIIIDKFLYKGVLAKVYPSGSLLIVDVEAKRFSVGSAVGSTSGVTLIKDEVTYSLYCKAIKQKKSKRHRKKNGRRRY